MGTLTMKFGGSSIGTVAALTQVLSIVLHERKHWDNLLIVTSALDGVTDMLLEAAHLAQVSNHRGYRRIAATLRTRHLSLIEQLPLGTVERNTLQADIDRLLFDMLNLCQEVAEYPSERLSPEVTDMIAGVGERLSARIIAALLRENNLKGVAIDATDVIITDNVHGNANPDLEQTRIRIQQHMSPMLERDIIPVVTGFIASSREGKMTTLGRGGSDYSASILSLCINAEEVWVWSDVDGMMSSDPREVPDARVIQQLSYNEIAELAYFGARILHSRMIKPLREHRIPLHIKNVYKPQQDGTKIHDVISEQLHEIKAVTAIHGLAVTADRSGPATKVIDIVNEALLNAIGIEADVMITSQSSSSTFICFVVPTSAGIEAVDTVRKAVAKKLKRLQDHVDWQVDPVSIVTAIGEQIYAYPSVAASILEKLDGVHILDIAQGPSHCSLSVIIKPQDAEQVVHSIHSLITNSDADSDPTPTE